jgi:hypothetical protein
MQQQSLFDYIENLAPAPVPLLKLNQAIYLVIAGEIEKHKVTGMFPLKKECGYHLDGGTIWDRSINHDAFTDLKDAEKLAAENKLKYKHILASDMDVTDIKSYASKDSKLISTVAIVNKTMVYVKDMYRYDFMYLHETKQEANAFFKTTIEKWESKNMFETVVNPNLKNLYWCKDRYAHHNYFAFNFMN